MLTHSIKISDELTRLSHLSIADLQTEWFRIVGTDAPKNARRDYLLRAIAHQLQSVAHGGISKGLLRNLLKTVDAGGGASFKASSNTRVRTLKSGVRIYREWKGVLHEVEVTDSGYRYNDTHFKSLSVIARKITGTRWSGPRFFGIAEKVTEGSGGRRS